MMNNKLVELKVEKHGVSCNFCDKSTIDSLMLGPLYHLQGITVHYFCMLFSAGLSQNGEDNEGIFGFLPKDIKKELDRGKKLKCNYCKGRRATVGCSVKLCKTSFHYPCGLEHGSLFQFIHNYESFCMKHRKIPPIKLPKTSWECTICFGNFDDEKYPIKPPCCNNNNAVFHRKCIMESALASGLHFFKCPLCNDKTKFSDAMRLQGVYVPDRDAAWEMEPNAFSELNEQYNKCDKQPCLCPSGRQFNSEDGGDRWKIIRCGGCGAAGVHMKCGGLEVKTYRCELCVKVLKDCPLDFSDDEDNQSQGGGGTVERNRQLRISRRRFESSSSDEDEPVYNILDQLPKVLQVDTSSDSYDESSSTTTTESEMELVRSSIPKKQHVYGRTYKLVGVPTEGDDGAESLSEDDEEDFEETETEFTFPSTSRGNNIAAKVIPEIGSSNDALQVRTGLVEVSQKNGEVAKMVSQLGRIEMYPSNRSLRSKCKVSNINSVNVDPVVEKTVKELAQTFTTKLLDKLNDTTTITPEPKEEYRPHTLLKLENLDKQNDATCQPKITEIYRPSPNLKTLENLNDTTTAPQLKSTTEEYRPHPLPSPKKLSDKLNDITTSRKSQPKNIEEKSSKPLQNVKLFDKPNDVTSQSKSTKESHPDPLTNFANSKVEVLQIDDDDDDECKIELVKLVCCPKESSSSVAWEGNISTAYAKKIKKEPKPNNDIRKFFNGKLSREIMMNVPVFNISKTKANSGSDLPEVVILDSSSDDEEDCKRNDTSSRKENPNSGKSDKLPMPNRDRDFGCNSKRVRHKAVARDDEANTDSNKRPRVSGND